MIIKKHHRYFIFCLFLFFIFSACNFQKKSDDEKHLQMYFDEKQNINFQKFKDIFLIVISGNCGSCTEKTIKFLKQLNTGSNKKFTQYQKIVILPRNNAYVIDSIRNPTIQFIIDDAFELEKYGINFSRNTFFEFKNSKLVYKDLLYLNNVDTIAKKYGFVL